MGSKYHGSWFYFMWEFPDWCLGIRKVLGSIPTYHAWKHTLLQFLFENVFPIRCAHSEKRLLEKDFPEDFWACWFRGMILTWGVRGPTFNSWTSPCLMPPSLVIYCMILTEGARGSWLGSGVSFLHKVRKVLGSNPSVTHGSIICYSQTSHVKGKNPLLPQPTEGTVAVCKKCSQQDRYKQWNTVHMNQEYIPLIERGVVSGVEGGSISAPKAFQPSAHFMVCKSIA